MHFYAETEIHASPEKVWAILTDAAKYPEWDPNMVELEGTIGLGEKLTAHTKLSKEAFPVTVTEFVPQKQMTWTGGMPLGLFKGVRVLKLEPTAKGVKFSTREDFSGLLLPIFGKTVPDMNPVFAEFAAALKKRAEA
jgi:hypothetical protein